LRSVDVIGGGEAETELGLSSILADGNSDRLQKQNKTIFIIPITTKRKQKHAENINKYKP